MGTSDSPCRAQRRRISPILLLSVLLTAACSGKNADQPPQTGVGATDRAIQRLEMRLDQLEDRIEEAGRSFDQADEKTPAGPLRSLTLRLGTDDDRLRLYWADGQRSDLLCSEEGKGVWACG